MKLIESKTLGTAQASIEFTSIPNTFTDLVFLWSLRATGNGNDNVGDTTVTFNGSSANFTFRYLGGQGINAFSASGTSGFLGWHPSNTATSNTFGNSSLYIPNYTGSTNKSYSVDQVSENNATVTYSSIVAGLWSNTATISSVAFFTSASTFAIGSTISLYGILKGSDGIVTTS